MSQSSEIPGPVRDLAARLAQPQPMRRGSLSERYVKCSKPGCGCAENPRARHGPYYSLTRAVAGQTRSRLIRAEEADLVRGQIEAGHRFRPGPALRRVQGEASGLRHLQPHLEPQAVPGPGHRQVHLPPGAQMAALRLGRLGAGDLLPAPNPDPAAWPDAP